MKRLFILAIMATMFMSCTKNGRVRHWGGTGTLDLPKGQKLVNLTWKDSDLWVLTTEMDSGYIPKTYKFTEDSKFGMMEGTYIVKETR